MRRWTPSSPQQVRSSRSPVPSAPAAVASARPGRSSWERLELAAEGLVLQRLVLAVADDALVAQRLRLRDLVGRARERDLAQLLVGVLDVLRTSLRRALGHALSARDEVDERRDERHEDQEDQPDGLQPAVQRVVAEDVDDDVD